MSQSRQLAAIMFTDIVGYTALMGDDEQKAFELLKKNRELQKPVIEEFNGRFIKELGDGVMASFNTVSDAVNAAIGIQKKCNADKEFLLRIGIHLGEVVFENGDVFGDGVNIASRIQALAPPGGIWISESVHNNVSNKNDIVTEFVKVENLKNVKDPIRIYQVKVEGVEAPKPAIISPKKSGPTGSKTLKYKKPVLLSIGAVLILASGYFIYNSFQKGPKENTSSNTTEVIDKSIAVLPFVNISNDKEQEYFSDGLSEELLNLLAKVPGLKVIGRTSSFYFKGKNEDLRLIGEKLGASYLLEGSVRRSGNKLRISANLIKTDDGSHLWSETYNRVEEDIFQIQDDVAASVVKQLQLKLVPAAQHGGTTSNIEAYNLVLQGNYFFDRLDKENVLKSINLYQNAIAIDSTYAKAWAVLARSYSRLAWFNFMDQNEGYEKARSASMKALELNPNSVDGLRALGDVKQYHDFNWKGAEADFKRALEIEPGNAEVLSVYSVWHQIKGDFNKASLFSKEALSKDPLRPLYYIIEGAILSFSGEYKEAIAMNKKVLEINPAAQRAYGFIGRNYLFMGKIDDALTAISKEPWDQFREFSLNLYFHAAGRKKEADEALKHFIEKYEKEWPYYIASLYAYRGEKNNAIEWLEKAFERKDTYMVYVKSDPLLKNLQNDSRYISILRRMSLN